MSFSSRISRFRDFVRSGSKQHDSNQDGPSFSVSMPNLQKIAGLKNVEGIPLLDIAELSGRGARAILMPEDSVFSSLLLGVNIEFSSLFGFDPHELQSKSLTSLTGPTTDTKRLQAMWAQVLSGSEESFQYNLYHKQ